MTTSSLNIRRSDPFRPAEQYEEWREEGPLKRVTLPSGIDSWLVLRNKEALEILGQTECLSSDPLNPGYPHMRKGPPTGNASTQLLRMDPPLHTKFRRMFAPFFSPKRVEQWKPELRRIVDETIDDFLAQDAPADFHQEVALVVASKAICMLLGVDYAHHTDFERLTNITASSFATAEERAAANLEMQQLISDLIKEQRVTSREGVIAKLVALLDAGEITHEVAVANTFLLLAAGHETSAHTMSLGTIQMIDRPDLREAIAEDPSKLPILADEMVRVHAITDMVVGRAVTGLIEVADTTIEPGEGIIFVGSSVNQDPRAFANANEIDLDRRGSSHIGFGGGIHACLGQSLARAELSAVFGVLFERIPTLRIAQDQEIEFKNDPWAFGIYRLPVEW